MEKEEKGHVDGTEEEGGRKVNETVARGMGATRGREKKNVVTYSSLPDAGTKLANRTAGFRLHYRRLINRCPRCSIVS